MCAFAKTLNRLHVCFQVGLFLAKSIWVFQCQNLFSQIYNQMPYFISFYFLSKIFGKPNKFVHIECTRVFIALSRSRTFNRIFPSFYDWHSKCEPTKRESKSVSMFIPFQIEKVSEQYSYSKCNLNTDSTVWSLKMREWVRICIMIYSVRTRKHCYPIY